MEIAIVFLVITMIAIMFWSIKVSKRFSIVVFSIIFFGIAIAMLAW